MKPKCFISYSHDNDAHKAWVSKLASDLVANQVDVTLDQRNLRLGADLVSFMVRAIDDSDRVLMICTANYAEKADKRKGGVGYEGMIISGKIYESTDTTKFIPVLRGPSSRLPSFLGPRLYIDFSSDSEYSSCLSRLVAELHGASAPSPPSSADPGFGDKAGAEPKRQPRSESLQIAPFERWLRWTNPEQYCESQLEKRKRYVAKKKQIRAELNSQLTKLRTMRDRKLKEAEDWEARIQLAENQGRSDLVVQFLESKKDALRDADEHTTAWEEANALVVAEQLRLRPETRLLEHVVPLARTQADILKLTNPKRARAEFRRIGDLLSQIQE